MNIPELNSTFPLENYATASDTIPLDTWKFTKLLDDIIMAEYADSDADGNVKRGGLFLATSVTQATWRVGKVVMAGEKVPEYIKEGTYFMFPNDRGIKTVSRDGKQYIFLNIDRIFGIVEPQDTPDAK